MLLSELTLTLIGEQLSAELWLTIDMSHTSKDCERELGSAEQIN